MTLETGLDACCTAIARFTDISSLTIDFQYPVVLDGLPEVPPVFMGALEPILQLQRLTRLDIQILYLHLDDTAIASMAAAFPHIRHLRLEFSRDSNVTFLGLIPLATQCPELEMLILSELLVVEQEVPPPSTVSSGSKLHFFEVNNNPPATKEFIEMVLSRYFPLLPEITMCYARGGSRAVGGYRNGNAPKTVSVLM
ncbi:hypothetical protein HGRIS_004206 [Hohenbuehelia grisea]|uniref:Uncharacterized protein n=1 Tax=Hohenbuehelia grisea TaxID=104357 RepID=A0ABR3JIT4_9AGAR